MLDHGISVRTDFSLGESIANIPGLVEKASSLGYKSLATADIMSVSSLVQFSSACSKAGIKPVIGCTIRVHNDPTYRPPGKRSGIDIVPNPFFWVKVYAKSAAGLQSLFRLLSAANSESYFYYHARVGMKELLELTDVVVTTGDFYNLFHHPEYMDRLAQISAAHTTFVEIVPINTPLFDTLNRKAAAAATALSLPTITTLPVLSLDDGDADSLDVMKAIATNTSVNSMWMPKHYVRDFHLQAPSVLLEKAKALMAREPSEEIKRATITGIQNLAVLVDLCEYTFTKQAPCLPAMAENEFGELGRLIMQGWMKRFSAPVLGHQPAAEEMADYKERLAFEMKTLRDMGFAGYFLLVNDIVQSSKQAGIFVGPGRGSVGGSLVAYLLGITDVDPIRFGLLFERFINPSRIDLPDADLDFMTSRRGEVLEYIINKYGEDRVAGISNYTTLGAASAIRDVSRLHDLKPYDYSCSKQVEKEHGVALSLEQSAETVPDIRKFKSEHPVIWRHATRLEGNMRGLGQHAAGVIVAGEPIVNRAVVEDRSKRKVVNWDKNTVEDWGLIKMDILGLSTLDILAKAAEYIKERHGIEIDYLRIPLDEPDIMDAFGKGDTTAVFQFESPGMKKLLKDLAVGSRLTFNDIAAVTALYRPGPLDAGMTDDFVRIRRGEKEAHYEHPCMKPILEETHGVLAYQEQIMRLCQDLAGFSGAEADNVRKAMGKKDLEKMKGYKEQFVAGAVESGMAEYAADDLWEKVAGFAGYGFNKSHSVEYTVISYWSMFLKVRYPLEFFAAAMTVAGDDEKVAASVLDARSASIEIVPPDINQSSDRIEIVGDKLYAPFQAIKGISERTAGFIVAARKALKEGHYAEADGSVCVVAPSSGGFTSKGHFEAVLTNLGTLGKVNSANRERLERVGAFASVTPGAKPATHLDRLKDRLELMPGFTVDAVKADRSINAEREAQTLILRVISDYRACDVCDFAGNPHVNPTIGKKPVFMMVSDSPNWKEEKAGRMVEGDTAIYLKAALKDADMNINDGYYTALVKAMKPSGMKVLPADAINGCSQFLDREIDILKPAIIVAMGSNAIRKFAPGVKGAPGELVGKAIYDPKLDATIIFGFNLAQLAFDPSKAVWLQKICAKIAELAK